MRGGKLTQTNTAVDRERRQTYRGAREMTAKICQFDKVRQSNPNVRMHLQHLHSQRQHAFERQPVDELIQLCSLAGEQLRVVVTRTITVRLCDMVKGIDQRRDCGRRRRRSRHAPAFCPSGVRCADPQQSALRRFAMSKRRTSLVAQLYHRCSR